MLRIWKKRYVTVSLVVCAALVASVLWLIALVRIPTVRGEATGAALQAAEEVYVPAGEFLMGCATDIWYRCDGDSKPIHAVYLDAYYIDKTEVTVAAYAQCVNAGVCAAPDYDRADSGFGASVGATSALDAYPVTHVTWNDANSYCLWVGKRLPTEAEWEKAAHGPDMQIYPWGNEAPTCELANFNNCEGREMPVGSYPDGASPYGALDMAGNVREWVNDYYKSDYYSRSPYFNPPGPEREITVGEHLLRGGSWKDDYSGITTWIRFDEAETYYIYKAGFRCARTASGSGTPTPTPTPMPTPTPTPYAVQTLDDSGGAVWLERPERLALVEMAPGSLAHTTAVTLSYADLPAPQPLAGIDQAFRLQTTSGTSGSTTAEDRLATPALVVVTFPRHNPLISGTRHLYRLNGGAWITDGITLTSEGMNYLRARVDYTGVYAVLGSANRLYLPMMMR